MSRELATARFCVLCRSEAETLSEAEGRLCAEKGFLTPLRFFKETPMPLTKRDVINWAELLQLIAQMALAAVAALDDDDPVDFDAVKITRTPEEALRRQREQR